MTPRLRADWLVPEINRPLGIQNRQKVPEDRKARKRAEAALRQKLSPYRKRLGSLEKEMETQQADLQEVEEALADPGLYEAEGKDRLKSLLDRQAAAKVRLQALEAEWLELGETIEELEAGLPSG